MIANRHATPAASELCYWRLNRPEFCHRGEFSMSSACGQPAVPAPGAIVCAAATTLCPADPIPWTIAGPADLAPAFCIGAPHDPHYHRLASLPPGTRRYVDSDMRRACTRLCFDNRGLIMHATLAAPATAYTPAVVRLAFYGMADPGWLVYADDLAFIPAPYLVTDLDVPALSCFQYTYYAHSAK